MKFQDLRPLSITLYLTSIITIPLSLIMGLLGFLGLFIEIPMILFVLIFSGIYLFHSVKNHRIHIIVFYPLVLAAVFMMGFMWDITFSNNTIAILKSYGSKLELFQAENKSLPKNQEALVKLGIDPNCKIEALEDGKFQLEFRDGIYNSFDHQVMLRPRP